VGRHGDYVKGRIQRTERKETEYNIYRKLVIKIENSRYQENMFIVFYLIHRQNIALPFYIALNLV
jgi:hypothetical protein